GDGLDAATNALTELQGKGKFTLSDKSIICNIDSIGIDFNTYEGISINFDNKTYLQFTLLFDFAHFEYGGSISFRYQQ
ncbi:MAG: hypothetical protein LBV52_01235, partial [Spirochaetaceae bacterium]|nr:hypothetical protein [Spirochaetaceae bacterium]